MPKRPWAGDEQHEFLNSQLPKYLEAQPTKDYNSFWSRLFEDWFARWPEGRVLFPNKSDGEELTKEEEVALGSAQKVRRERLQTWYRYRTSTTHNKRAAIATKKIAALQTRTRLPQKQELYSQMYKELIKPTLADALKAENATTPAEKLAIIKRVQKEAYMNASDDVKQEVEDALAQKVLAKASLREKDTPRTAKEYQDAINECPSILRQLMESLAECTGWSFTILMGGPEPKNNGKMACWSFHYGENMLGNSFNDAHPSFEQSYMGPYNEFLEHVYPDSVRRSRSLAENKGEGVIKDQSENKNQEEMSEEEITSEGEINEPHDANPVQSDDRSAAQNMLDASMTSLNDTSLQHSDEPQDSAKAALPFDASLPPAQATPYLGHLPAHGNEFGDEPQDSAKVASPFDASLPPTHATPDLGYLPTHGNEFGVGQNVNNYTFIHGPNTHQQSASPDMGVDLDPFSSAIMNNNDDQTDWRNWDLFFASLDVSQRPIQMDGIDAAGPDSHSARDTGINKQGSPSRTDNAHINGSEPSNILGYAEPVNNHSPTVSTQVTQHTVCHGVSDAPVDGSGNQSPDTNTTTATRPMPNDQTLSEGKSVQKLSKSGRAIIPSTRLEKMNEIGSNKENVSPAMSRNESADGAKNGAKEYMLGLKLGEDWKECIDTWLRVEESLGSKGTLPTGDRPQEWKAWTSKGRSGLRPYNVMPIIKDVEEFGLACINWWNKLQPSFRYNEQGLMPLSNFIPPDAEALEDVWEPLRKGGQNGLIIVLLLFSWWGQKLQQTVGCSTEMMAQWCAAITDLRHTLEAMGATAQKRVSPTDAMVQARNKRRRSN